jgi:hypothetical protein
MVDAGQVLTSDATQYALPIYHVTSRTPSVDVTYSGWFSDVTNDGDRLIDYRYGGDTTRQHTRVPIPAGAVGSAGTDANVAIINTDTGEEWDLHTVNQDPTTRAYTASNIGHYNIAWSGVPPFDTQQNDPYWLGGAGIPYLAGHIRPCEIAQGHIDHALALGIPHPASNYVYPASKSDGDGTPGVNVPEGGHLQLDPTIPDDTIRGWGCTGTCFTIAKALQRYGAYIVDVSGRPKLAAEGSETADWGNTLTASTVSPIPIGALKLLR